MKPTLGRIVIYNTTSEDRNVMIANMNCNVQEKLPAEVVATFEGYENGECNLKVRMDGDMSDMWKTSVPQGDAEGNWNWPPRV